MSSSSKTVQELLQQGIESTNAHRFGEAGQHFLEGLELIETWPDGHERSHELGIIALLFSRTGHPDLSLMALQGLLESKVRKNHPGEYCADLLTLANSWNGLGRPAASTTVNKVALTHALKYERFADAASASTNLAINDANSGRLPEALQRLQESLELLTKEPNPDTDAITRLTLIQVVDIMGAEPAIALEASADLFTRLMQYVGPERWDPCAPAFHRLINRYLATHPELDAEAWKQKTFPLVFGES